MGILEILGLNLGNLNVSVALDQRDLSWNNSVLDRRASTVLPRHETAVGLHESLIVARDVLERDIQVPSSELEDILAKIRDLESQVEGLLGDDGDSVEVNTTTENAQGSSGASNSEDGDEEEIENTDSEQASSDSGNIPGGAMFKEKVEVETEVVTTTMGDLTTTITKTRTMTETVTITPDVPVASTTEVPFEPTSDPMDSSSDLTPSEPAAQPANVRLGGAFKEVDQPFSATNATAVQLNVAQPSKIPGNVVSAPPTSLPVPAVKQFHQAVYTNSSASTGFQTVTLPGAQ